MSVDIRVALEAGIAAFAARGVPEVAFGCGRVRDIAEDAAAVGDPDRPVVLITDATLVRLGAAP